MGQSCTNSQSNWFPIDLSLPQFDFSSNHEDLQPTLEETFENFMQFSQRMLSDNVQLLAHLDMLTSELASGQENDSFFTQSVLEQTSSI